jgi:hypothetical protein
MEIYELTQGTWEPIGIAAHRLIEALKRELAGKAGQTDREAIRRRQERCLLLCRAQSRFPLKLVR